MHPYDLTERVSFELGRQSLDGMSLIMDTELTRYELVGVNGYQLVVMPMLTVEANEQAKKQRGKG